MSLCQCLPGLSHHCNCPTGVLQNLLQGALPNKFSRERDKSLSISLSDLPVGGNMLSVRGGAGKGEWDGAQLSLPPVCV